MSVRTDVLFVNRLFPNGFTPESSAADGLGGIELTTIQLARALTKKGVKVVLVNQVKQKQSIDGITTYPIDCLSSIYSNVIISSNDAIPFATKKYHKSIYWMHNPLRIEKAIRRKQLFPLVKTHPHAVFVGHVLARRQRFFPYFRSRKIIGHGISDIFRYQPRNIPAPIVVWSSQPQRGLSRILRIWVKKIAPEVPTAKFLVFTRLPKDTEYSAEQLGKAGVVLMPRVSQNDLAEHLRQARIMIYPGYEDETFCSAAAEAICCGVPVITEGIGSLSERVTHEKTGISCKGDSAIASWAVRLLTDDHLWQAMQPHCAAESENLRWESVAEEWIRHIETLD